MNTTGTATLSVISTEVSSGTTHNFSIGTMTLVTSKIGTNSFNKTQGAGFTTLTDCTVENSYCTFANAGTVQLARVNINTGSIIGFGSSDGASHTFSFIDSVFSQGQFASGSNTALSTTNIQNTTVENKGGIFIFSTAGITGTRTINYNKVVAGGSISINASANYTVFNNFLTTGSISINNNQDFLASVNYNQVHDGSININQTTGITVEHNFLHSGATIQNNTFNITPTVTYNKLGGQTTLNVNASVTVTKSIFDLGHTFNTAFNVTSGIYQTPTNQTTSAGNFGTYVGYGLSTII